MTKLRFTDCDIWEGEWFMSLSLEMKLLWRYLCDRCDNAGVWLVNQKLAEFHLGFEFDPADALRYLAAEVEPMAGGTKWRLRNFLRFQYPKGLGEKSIPHQQVLRTLASHGLDRDGQPLGKAQPSLALSSESTLATNGSRVAPTLKDKDTDQTRTRIQTRQGESEGDEPRGAVVRPADRWIYVQAEPWCASLRAANVKIRADNWEAWKALCVRAGGGDPVRGVMLVAKAAATVPATQRWSDRVEEAMVGIEPEPSPAKPKRPPSLIDQAKALATTLGPDATLKLLALPPHVRQSLKDTDDLLGLLDNEVWAKQLVERSGKQGAA